MIVSIVLAAGEGTRMKSDLPKVLHRIAGKPLVDYVIRSAKEAGAEETVVVIGHKADLVNEELKNKGVVIRKQPMSADVPYGTGFAVMQSLDCFKDDDVVVILTGDTPLITADTLKNFINFHQNNGYEACVLTANLKDPTGYGRIVRRENSSIGKIVEEKDASIKEKAIQEVNSGIFTFQGRALRNALTHLETDNAQGELYLTDVIKILNEKGHKVGGYTLKDANEMLGINSRIQLAHVDSLIRKRINERHMENGVSFMDPGSTIVEDDVEIGQDTIIYPGVVLSGKTKIGSHCVLYGSTRVVDSTVGDHVILDNVLIEESIVHNHVKLGPYAHLRPKSEIKDHVKIGNFVEVKNASLGEGTKAGHLAYIGDASVGDGVNIGCGTIFVNYNGLEKFHTNVGDHAFIGSNSNLVAPVEVEDYGYIAAGSTITKKVEEGQLAIERGKQKNIDHWSERIGMKKDEGVQK